MDEKFRKLIELGAGDFEHADGALIAHLEGTSCLLKEWHGTEALQQAGLYHGAYGSPVKADGLFASSQRQEVAAVIGPEPENIVYHYFACQQAPFFAQFGKLKQPIFYDRLSNKASGISTDLLLNLCELFAAKQLDLVIYHPEYAAKHAKSLVELFSRMQVYLSASAKRKIDFVLAAKI